MKIVETAKGKWLFVEVPDGAKDFRVRIRTVLVPFNMWYVLLAEQSGQTLYEPLPTKCEFISTYSAISEEQAMEIVEKVLYDKWKNYATGTQYMEYLFDSAGASLHSLMRSHNLTGNFAILKIQ